MCGIIGIIANYSLSNDELGRAEVAVERLEKRGPDARGIVNYDSAVLAHRRLSIVVQIQLLTSPWKMLASVIQLFLTVRFITIKYLKMI